MRISLFKDNAAMNGKPVFEAFEKSLLDDECDVVYNDMDADVAVIWSVLWAGRMAGNKKVWDHYRSQKKPVIVLEVGGLARNETWKVGINGVNRAADFGNHKCDSSRVSKLGLELKPWGTGTDILVCGQHGGSLQWEGMLPVQDWMLNVVREIRRYTNQKIILRPHPRYLVQPEYAKEFSNVLIANPKPIEGSYDDFNFEEALERSAAMVCYSSGPACRAIINGVPAFVSNDSLARPVGNFIGDLERIIKPSKPDRTQWLNDLSYTEWTVQEIRDGVPWHCLKKKL